MNVFYHNVKRKKEKEKRFALLITNSHWWKDVQYSTVEY